MSRDNDAAAVGVRMSFEAMIGQLNKTMGSMTDGLDRIHKFMTANPVHTPLLRTIIGSATAPASALTYTFMDMGGPPNGWRRNIRWFEVWGPDPTAQLTGVSVFAFIAGAGQYQDNSTEPAGFTEMTTLSSQTVPNRFTAGSEELTLTYGRRLIVCFKSLANNQQVNGYGQAWDYKESTIVGEPL